MDVRLCPLCECLSHLLSLTHDSILADEYSANLMVNFTTDFKSASGVLTEFYYALPSRIYRCFSRQSKLHPAWYRHVAPHVPLVSEFDSYKPGTRSLSGITIRRGWCGGRGTALMNPKLILHPSEASTGEVSRRGWTSLRQACRRVAQPAIFIACTPRPC
jgi:hypothetical protein